MTNKIHIIGLLLTAMMLSLSGCIDDYDADISSEDGHRLVVEGSIMANTLCSFYLTYSVGTSHTDREELSSQIVTVQDAKIYVKGDDGTIWQGWKQGSEYKIAVGQLQNDVRYWLEIITEDGSFESSHDYPTITPEIERLGFTQLDGEDVKILLTTASSDPEKPIYLKWTFDEDWEIYTPYCASWAYIEDADRVAPRHTPSINPVKDDSAAHMRQGRPISPRHTRAVKEDTEEGSNVPSFFHELQPKDYTNHGWAHSHSVSELYGSSEQYTDNHIAGLAIMTIGASDNRLQTRYRINVQQRAISKAEYEYLELRHKQTSEMGGLFTPLPSELPTNIHCTNGKMKAVGYVGVSGSSQSKVLYINRREVIFKPAYKAEQLNDDACIERGLGSYHARYSAGLRLLMYDEQSKTSIWTYPWCVDCRVSYWNCSLAKPDGWEE